MTKDAEILSVNGVGWITDILRRVPGLELDAELSQEDWGVAIFVTQGAKRFWVGVNWLGDGEWLLHLHYGSLAWLRRLRQWGKDALRRLVADVDSALRTEPAVTDVVLGRYNDFG